MPVNIIQKICSIFLLVGLIAPVHFTVTAQSLASLAVNSAKSPGFNESELEIRLKRIEKIVEERRRKLGIPGLAPGIVKGDKVICMNGFGAKNPELDVGVTPDTQFAIASSTKAFTAMTAMMSVDDGKLALDDSPKKYLPYFNLRDADADARVTLRDLLSHQTGLGRTDLSLQFPQTLSRKEAIKIAGLAQPSAKFREKFQYQNTMYAAGDAIAKANGKIWESLVETKIFKPLGMTATDTSVVKMQQSPDARITKIGRETSHRFRPRTIFSGRRIRHA